MDAAAAGPAAPAPAPQEMEETWECPDCGRSYLSKDAALKHMRKTNNNCSRQPVSLYQPKEVVDARRKKKRKAASWHFGATAPAPAAAAPAGAPAGPPGAAPGGPQARSAAAENDKSRAPIEKSSLYFVHKASNGGKSDVIIEAAQTLFNVNMPLDTMKLASLPKDYQVNGQSENLNGIREKKAVTSTTTLGVKRSALGEIGNNVVGCSNSVATLEPGALPRQKEFVKPIQRSYSTGSCINVKPPKDLVRPLPSPNIAARVKRTVSNTSVASVVLPAPQTQPSVKEEDAAVQPEDFVEDVDKADENNPLVVADYLDLLCSREEKYPIKKGFLHESYISPRMRAELVDWLVDVQLTLRLLPETLYFAVQILDRYLQAVPTVGKDNLQLVGVAAMYVACKYDEKERPPTDDFLSSTKYNEELLLTMEDQILKTLESLFSHQISLNYLRRFSKVLKVKNIHHYFSKFFLELALMEYSLCHVPPSLIAAAALYISLCILELNEKTGPQNWDANMVHHSSYKLPEVEECAKALAAVIVQSSTWKYEAVKKKYSNSKMKEVALRQELTSECVIRLSEGKSPFP